MTHKKTTTDADENVKATPAEQAQEQELASEIEEALEGGEGSEPDDLSLNRMDDDGGAINPDDDDPEC